MKIDNYKFGRITIDGNDFTNDVIIFPHQVKSNWWRKEGHNLYLEDLEEVVNEKPEILIIGKGAYGRMQVRKKVKEKLKEKGINEVIDLETAEACEKFNNLVNTGKNVVAALHLTC